MNATSMIALASGLRCGEFPGISDIESWYRLVRLGGEGGNQATFLQSV